MTLLAKLKTWLHPDPVITPKSQLANKTAQAAPTAEVTVQGDCTANRVRVVVLYRNIDANEDLRPPETLVGRPGETLTMTWRTIPGFVLTEVLGYTTTFPDANQAILCAYSARVAGPVVVYHRDVLNRLVAPPEIIKGELNDTFTAAALNPNQASVIGPSQLAGTFTASSQRIHFRYQLNHLETGELAEIGYVTLLAAKPVYGLPRHAAPLAAQLPVNTAWKVFAMMRETDTQTVWFSIGGGLWITAEATRAEAQHPFLKRLDPCPTAGTGFKTAETPVDLKGIIQGGDHGVTLWQAPYGAIKHRRLLVGTPVTIEAVVRLENGTQWYRLNQPEAVYVLAEFVALKG